MSADCPTCQHLTRENRELREELSEWERAEAERIASTADADKVAALSIALSIWPTFAKALLRLATASPCCVNYSELVERDGRDGRAHTAMVYVCMARAALDPYGYRPSIKTHRGIGYSLDVAGATFVRSLAVAA